MRLESFRGLHFTQVMESVRRSMGEDAMIVRSCTRRIGGAPVVEVAASTSEEIAAFRNRLQKFKSLAQLRKQRQRPLMVALVGPSGAGKTTTLAKLAVNRRAFGGWRTGVITLDTFRVGALEQLQTYTDIVDLPLEVVYEAGDVSGALRRLRGCEVILVDTPGRAPRTRRDYRWQALLEPLRLDETHLVLPAGLRGDVACRMRNVYAGDQGVHLLLTKLDEVPGEVGVLELAGEMGLPSRWATDGQEVPGDLHPAAARLLSAWDSSIAMEVAG